MEVLAALTVTILLAAGSLVVGRQLLAHQQEEVFLRAVAVNWTNLRRRVDETGQTGKLTVTADALSYSLADVRFAYLPVPASMVLTEGVGVITYSGVGAFSSVTAIKLTRGNGRLVTLSFQMQWGLFRQKEEAANDTAWEFAGGAFGCHCRGGHGGVVGGVGANSLPNPGCSGATRAGSTLRGQGGASTACAR